MEIKNTLPSVIFQALKRADDESSVTENRSNNKLDTDEEIVNGARYLAEALGQTTLPDYTKFNTESREGALAYIAAQQAQILGPTPSFVAAPDTDTESVPDTPDAVSQPIFLNGSILMGNSWPFGTVGLEYSGSSIAFDINAGFGTNLIQPADPLTKDKGATNGSGEGIHLLPSWATYSLGNIFPATIGIGNRISPVNPLISSNPLSAWVQLDNAIYGDHFNFDLGVEVGLNERGQDYTGRIINGFANYYLGNANLALISEAEFGNEEYVLDGDGGLSAYVNSLIAGLRGVYANIADLGIDVSLYTFGKFMWADVNGEESDPKFNRHLEGGINAQWRNSFGLPGLDIIAKFALANSHTIFDDDPENYKDNWRPVFEAAVQYTLAKQGIRLEAGITYANDASSYTMIKTDTLTRTDRVVTETIDPLSVFNAYLGITIPIGGASFASGASDSGRNPPPGRIPRFW